MSMDRRGSGEERKTVYALKSIKWNEYENECLGFIKEIEVN